MLCPIKAVRLSMLLRAVGPLWDHCSGEQARGYSSELQICVDLVNQDDVDWLLSFTDSISSLEESTDRP